jgi:hypothetical protein
MIELAAKIVCGIFTTLDFRWLSQSVFKKSEKSAIGIESFIKKVIRWLSEASYQLRYLITRSRTYSM